MTQVKRLARSPITWALIALMSLSFFVAPFALAQGEAPEAPAGDGEATAGDFGLGEFNSEADFGEEGLIVTVARIINVALSLLGVVAVVIILIGGFQWMTAGGNDEKVAGARKLIFSGIIGMAIILSAFAIARFVLGSLSVATNTGTLEP